MFSDSLATSQPSGGSVLCVTRRLLRPLQMPSEEQWWSKPGAYKPQRRSGPFDARNKSVTTVTQTWSPPSWPLVCPVKMRPSKVRELSRPCDLVASVRPIGKVGSQLYETAPPGRQSPSRRRPVDLEAANLLKHDDNFDELGRPVDRWGIPIVSSSKPSQPSCPSRSTAALGILQTAARGIRPGTAPGKLLTASPPRRSREPSPPLPSAPILLAHLRAAVADLVAADLAARVPAECEQAQAARWRRCMGHALPADLGKVGAHALWPHLLQLEQPCVEPELLFQQPAKLAGGEYVRADLAGEVAEVRGVEGGPGFGRSTRRFASHQILRAGEAFRTRCAPHTVRSQCWS